MYHKACTNHFPVLLCATKLAQSTSSTTLYYKACTKHVPVLLCTTKLARSMSQYYFVLCKASPSITFCYKACTKNPSANISLWQPWRSHSHTIYDAQLQKTIVLKKRMLGQWVRDSNAYNGLLSCLIVSGHVMLHHVDWRLNKMNMNLNSSVK